MFISTEKYPQIKKLFGYDPNFKWVVTFMVLIQFASMFIVKDLSYPMLFLMAYCFGGVINHSLMLGESFLNLTFICWLFIVFNHKYMIVPRMIVVNNYFYYWLLPIDNNLFLFFELFYLISCSWNITQPSVWTLKADG